MSRGLSLEAQARSPEPRTAPIFLVPCPGGCRGSTFGAVGRGLNGCGAQREFVRSRELRGTGGMPDAPDR